MALDAKDVDHNNEQRFDPDGTRNRQLYNNICRKIREDNNMEVYFIYYGTGAPTWMKDPTHACNRTNGKPNIFENVADDKLESTLDEIFQQLLTTFTTTKITN